MLIFVPPSETKAFPAGTAPLDLDSLVLPELGPTRTSLLEALTALVRGPAPAALAALGLSEGQAGELVSNAELAAAPAGPAAEVYTGVLHDALDLPALRCQSVATDQVLIFSGLWGVLRPGDRIPHYRCSAGVKLPGAGPVSAGSVSVGSVPAGSVSAGSVSATWRRALRGPLADYVGDQLVVDLRSGAYASLWAPGANAVTVRVLHEREVGGVLRRSVVSHFNKATKGRLARALLESGQQPDKPGEFADLLRDMGHTVEPGPASGKADRPTALDIVVREL